MDLIHVKHAFGLIVNNCVLDHSTTSGKYCIIYHKDDLTTYANDSLFVINTKFIGSQDNQALVKPSIHYASFKDCLFFDAIRTMQDVTVNLEVDNCFFKSTVPLANQLFGIQNNDNQNITNSTFEGIKSPYANSQSTTNCIFWNCSGNGNYTNCVTDPLLDATYTATAPGLIGVGYVAHSLTQMEPLRENKELLFYPNPANNHISFLLHENSTVYITDVNGRNYFSEFRNAGFQTIVLNMDAGIYLIQVIGNKNKVYTGKIIKR